MPYFLRYAMKKISIPLAAFLIKGLDQFKIYNGLKLSRYIPKKFYRKKASR
jgi:hypothetical protein